jgi:DNA-binding beta-propeller fold protein YncE
MTFHRKSNSKKESYLRRQMKAPTAGLSIAAGASVASSAREKSGLCSANARGYRRLALLIALIALLLLPAVAQAGYEQAGGFGKESDGTELFVKSGGGGAIETAGPTGIAANESSGDIYVADQDNQRIDRFTAAGDFLEAWGWGVATGAEAFEKCISSCRQGILGEGAGQFAAPVGVAVDQNSGAVYVLNGGRSTGVVQKFSPSGSYLLGFADRGESTEAQIESPSPTANCIAVGPEGDVFLVEEGGANYGPRVMVFDSTGSYKRSIGEQTPGFEYPQAIALDDQGDVYVGNQYEIYKFDPSGILAWSYFEESFSIGGMTVDAATGEVFFYAQYPAEFTQLNSQGTPVGHFPGKAGQSQFNGLAFNSNSALSERPSGTLYATDSDLHTGLIFAQPPLVTPAIDSQSAEDVGETSAKLKAQINPNGYDTTYYFEYGTAGPCSLNACTKGPLGTAKLAAGQDDNTVGLTVSELTSGTTYHYRVLASNIAGTTTGLDHTFTTFPPAVAGLADGRAYELVSPPAKLGEVFPPEGVKGPLGNSCFECQPGVAAAKMPMQSDPTGNAVVYEGQPFTGGLASAENEYRSERTGSGWSTRGLSLPQFGTKVGQGFKAFSPDLSRGVLDQVAPTLAPGAPVGYPNLYLWQESGALQPLLPAAPPNRVPGEGEKTENQLSMVFAGANLGDSSSTPFDYVIFEANDALTGATGMAPAAVDGGPEKNNLYASSGGQLHLVNVLPGNASTAPDAVFGAGRNTSESVVNVSHAISANGKRVFWTDRDTEQVYVREDDSRTISIPDPGTFLTASLDGSKLLLGDGHLYDLEAETMTDLTSGQGGFRGILGTSDDLSSVYFVDTEVLTGSGENSFGDQAEPGEFNLYAWRGGIATFVGVLGAKDNDQEFYGVWKPSPSVRLAQVSPDGRYLAFMSKAGLTGYDNLVSGSASENGGCSGSGDGEKPLCFEVFEYDAATADLTCASCNPTGQRPLGQSNLSLITFTSKTDLPQPQNLTADGRGQLFFESQDVLSSRDANGHVQDVYEWKPPGVSGCGRAAGCVSLISSGQGGDDSNFLNATPSGGDVFFVTRQELLPQDRDGFTDLYDARAGGGIAVTEVLPCGGEACKAPLSSSIAPDSAGSSTFTGPTSQKHRKHKAHRRHKVHKKHRRHSHRRSANRGNGGSK